MEGLFRGFGDRLKQAGMSGGLLEETGGRSRAWQAGSAVSWPQESESEGTRLGW